MQRKPTFLDCPPRYTRTPRLDQSMAEYARVIHRKNTGYSPVWWCTIVTLATVAAIILVVTA